MGDRFRDDFKTVMKIANNDPGCFNFSMAASEAKNIIYGRRKKKISRKQCNDAMKVYFQNGGKITRLPPSGVKG